MKIIKQKIHELKHLKKTIQILQTIQNKNTMKKIKLLASMAIIATTITSNDVLADKHRINYNSNYDVATGKFGENYGGNSLNPVFNDLDAAYNSVLVNPFDTLYLEACPAGTSYPGITMYKPFTIIGTGYFLSLNPKTSNDLLESRLEWITFSSTTGTNASGSRIIGVNITSQYGINVNTGVNDILIKRCYLNPNAEVNLDYNSSDIDILQNFFDNGSTPNTITGISFSQYGSVTDLRINHNIFKRTLYVASNNGATGGTTYPVQECKNNTFDCPTPSGSNPAIRMDCNSFHNNIIKSSTISLNINSGISSGSITNNTGAGATQFDYATSSYNNKLVSNMSSLFVTPTSSTDGSYQLQVASANNFSGLGGGDRGAFGGVISGNKYTLSGLANVPVIYDVYTTGTSSSGTLPVIIKARTIK